MALRVIPPNVSHSLCITRAIQCSRTVAIKCQNSLRDDQLNIAHPLTLKKCNQSLDVKGVFTECIPKVALIDQGYRQTKAETHSKDSQIFLGWKRFSLTSDDIILRKKNDFDISQLVNSDWLLPCRINKTSGKGCGNSLKLLDNYLYDLSNSCHHMTFCANEKSSKNSSEDKKQNRATLEQLLNVKEYYVSLAPKFFSHSTGTENIGMYNQDVVLHNNFFGKNSISRGINRYMLQMIKYKSLLGIRYNGPTLVLRNITVNQDESCVKIHWRITGDTIGKILKRLLPMIFPMTEHSNFIEGLSYIYVGAEGLIIKHRVERVMTDEAPRKKSRIASLAAALGFLPQSGGQETFIGLFKRSNNSDITI